jgi:ribosomal protein S1
VFVQLEAGLTALIPASETDLPRGADLAKSFLPGTRLTASVLTVDPARKRISLSLRKAKERKDAREFKKWTDEKKVERRDEVSDFGAALMRALKGKPSA